MSNVWKIDATGSGVQPGVSLVIQGGDTGGSYVWFRFLSAVRRHYEDVRYYPCRVTMPDHG